MTRWLFLCLALLFSGAAHAQSASGCALGTPACTQAAVFTPTGVTSLAAGVVSSSASFPTQGTTQLLVVTNAGAVQVNVLGGNSSVVATPTTGTPILPGASVCLPQGLNTTLAGITGSGSAALTLQSGTGACPLVLSGSLALAPGSQVTLSPGATVATTAGGQTIVPLDASAVTTGGTAVTALLTGHATAGGFIQTANAAGVCVDQVTTAGTVTGTPSTTTCVFQYQAYPLVPNGHAVSVNSPGSGVTFSGQGLN